MDAAIRTENLTKWYGQSRGIEGVDLEVPVAAVLGFLGPNGAGKTTTMRILMDLIRPTEGRAEVLGMDVSTRSCEIRRRVGYLPGDLALYERLTARETFEYFAHLRGTGDLGWAPELWERFALEVDRHIHDLSSGNRQKVGVIQAFMHRPELLILDEPTAGLDPLMQREFFRVVRDVTEGGGTVFLSSHVLSEVERIADRVAIIREGRLVETQSVEVLEASSVSRLALTFAGSVPRERFMGLAGVEDLVVEDHVLTCTVVGSVDPLLKAASEFEVVTVRSHEADLEEVFMRYFGESADVA